MMLRARTWKKSLGPVLVGFATVLAAAAATAVDCGLNPWPIAAGETEASAWDLQFVPDAGVRVENAGNASPAVDPDTGNVWLYYSDGPTQYRSVSEDGLDFPAGEVVTTHWKLDPRGTQLPDGYYRRYAYIPADDAFKSHFSTDGITYAPLGSTVHYSLQPEDENWVGVYTAFTNTSDDVVLIYLGANPGTARRAISSDGGNTFVFDQSNLLGDIDLTDCKFIHWDPRATLLEDGRVRLFSMVQGPDPAHPGFRAVGQVYSFISDDGTGDFELEAGIRLEPTDFGDLFLWSLHDPWVIQLPDGRYRMYVAAKATDDGAGTNLRSVIVSATTPTSTLPGPSPTLSALVVLGTGSLLAARRQRARRGRR